MHLRLLVVKRSPNCTDFSSPTCMAIVSLTPSAIDCTGSSGGNPMSVIKSVPCVIHTSKPPCNWHSWSSFLAVAPRTPRMQLLPLTWHFPSSMKFRHISFNFSGILPCEIILKVILYSKFLLVINFGWLSHVIYR